jgi:hypothetical protein|tara:strand:- start:508 stop:708 length:201 start_codon:yes stop_codon:yes gene_type:complete
MKYKDFNKIIKEYEKMASKNRRENNLLAANECEIIIEDLKLLFKLGYGKRLDIPELKLDLEKKDKK